MCVRTRRIWTTIVRFRPLRRRTRRRTFCLARSGRRREYLELKKIQKRYVYKKEIGAWPRQVRAGAPDVAPRVPSPASLDLGGKHSDLGSANGDASSSHVPKLSARVRAGPWATSEHVVDRANLGARARAIGSRDTAARDSLSLSRDDARDRPTFLRLSRFRWFWGEKGVETSRERKRESSLSLSTASCVSPLLETRSISRLSVQARAETFHSRRSGTPENVHPRARACARARACQRGRCVSFAVSLLVVCAGRARTRGVLWLFFLSLSHFWGPDQCETLVGCLPSITRRFCVSKA